MKLKAILIDDMQSALDQLRSDLHNYCPEVDVIGTASGVVSGAKLLNELSPDVLFLDIELEDGTGFDLLEILQKIDFKIIFVTASDQHAIRAFRFSAIDYLLKPINTEQLQEAVSKIINRDTRENVNVLLDHWSDKLDVPRIALHSSDEIKVVEINNIVRCEADNNYTLFIFKDGTRFLVTKTLKFFDKILEEHNFVRVHQSHLVNLNCVQSYKKTEGGYLAMIDGSLVPVSVRKKARVVALLKNRF